MWIESLPMDPFENTNPIYESLEPNEPIELGSLDWTLNLGAEEYLATGSARIDLLPTPGLVIKGLIDRPDPNCFKNLFGSGNEIYFHPAGSSELTRAIRRRIGTGENGISVELVPARQPMTIREGSGCQIKRVLFHVLNFPSFYNTGGPGNENRIIVDGNKHVAVGMTLLQMPNWRIGLTGTSRTEELKKALKESGGYALTHFGIIEREDEELFSSKDAEDILDIVRGFLSFARGSWSSVILPVGFDDAGNRVWEQWGVGSSSPWSSNLYWFDEMNGQMLEQVFPGFADLWQREVWNESLYGALYWYVQSNSSLPNTDTGLVLSQTALETLAWTYLVEDKKMLNKDGYNKLTAANRIRLLLGCLDLPREIPNCLSRLNTRAKEFNWADGPEALATVRNETVHPEHKHSGRFADVKYECYQLGQWFTELVILRLCNHMGEYSNRLSVHGRGEVSKVPWAVDVSPES